MLVGQDVESLVFRVKSYGSKVVYVKLLVYIIFFHGVQVCVDYIHARRSDHDGLIIVHREMLGLAEQGNSELIAGHSFLGYEI